MSQIVAFDVETPNRYNNRICSIGLTIINDGIITNTIHYLINPETDFDKVNIQIHGIKPSDVSNAPIFPEVWNEIAKLFRSSLITAHNATFDLCVLRKTLRAYEINESKINYVCTLQMASSIISDTENYKLPTLARYIGVDLEHHNAQSDCLCCAKILLVLLNSGVNLDKYMKAFDFAQIDLYEQKGSFSKVLNNQNQKLKALKDVLSAITCDNVLNEQEIIFLHNWLEENKQLSGNYPYDRIFDVISEVLADGIIEQHELDYMLELFKQISDPVGSLCNNFNSFDIKGKNIVLTGDFDRGDRKSLELELTSLGAICKNSVSKTTHYLVVGGQGSSMWYAGSYGTKVKKALELQTNGISIEIIRESDFYATLGATK